ncbi:MAG: nuclear transport factor 2 family protein [Actinomycetota bacterium]|nr:nuclear transport factor 2 family protein [Actinomycetota bacterium]MDQ2955734.1 nuclear transport factor 2 family protein [Actinomycetota bacterium]
MNDTEVLTDLNRRFIDAFRKGSWELLEPILSPGFSYLDGRTGDVREVGPYADNLRGHPSPTLEIDEVVVHVDGDAAIVSARTSDAAQPGKHSRYLDTYQRRGEGWICVHACVWPLP